MVSSDDKKDLFEETMDGLLDTVVRTAEEIGKPFFDEAEQILNEVLMIGTKMYLKIFKRMMLKKKNG